MNIFHQLTKETLKKNKTRTIVTIVGVILSTAMICAVTTFISSFQNFYYKEVTNNYGDWQMYIDNANEETYKKVCADERFKSVTAYQNFLPGKVEENNGRPNFVYVKATSSFDDTMLPLRLLEGEFPKNSNEIILARQTKLEDFGSFDIGDTVTLHIGNRKDSKTGITFDEHDAGFYYDNEGNRIKTDEIFEEKEVRTYTITGFFDDMYFPLDSLYPTGCTAFTIIDEENKDLEYSYQIFTRLKNPRDVNKIQEDSSTDYIYQGNEGVSYNSMVLMAYGLGTSGAKTVFISMAIVVTFLIMLGSVSLIYNAFDISVAERTKQFGLLSSIGASKKQIKKMIIYESLVISSVGIPLGIVSGIVGIGVTLMFIGEKFLSIGYSSPLTLKVSPISIILAAVLSLIIVLISVWIPSKRAMKVSPIDAIRQAKDIKRAPEKGKTPNWVYKFFGVPGLLGDKYYKRSKRKYVTTISSLCMSIVLFVSASTFINVFTDISSKEFYTTFNGVNYCESKTLIEENGITLDELKDKFSELENVTNVSYVRDVVAGVSLPKELYSADRLKLTNQTMNDVWVDILCVDDETYRQILKDNNLSEEKFMNPDNPLGIVVDNSRLYIDKQYKRTKILNTDTFKITSGDDTFVTGGSVDKVPDFMEPTYFNAKIIYPESLIKPYEAPEESNATGYFDYYDYYISSEHEVKLFEDTKKLLKSENMISDAEDKMISQITSDKKIFKNIAIIINVFSYGFITLISLIAAVNVFNTITNNIILRRREFAMLKSIGMTEKEFKKMLNFECVLYGSKSLLYGIPISILCSIVIWYLFNSGYKIKYRIPIVSIIIITIVIFIIVYSTMIYSRKRVSKDNIIEALKNENL